MRENSREPPQRKISAIISSLQGGVSKFVFRKCGRLLSPLPSTEQTSLQSSPRRYGLGGLLLWVVGLSVGFGWLMSYQTRSGAAAVSLPGEWPVDSALAFDSQRTNLVIFAHPKCPCTRATLDELEIVLTQRRSEIKATLCVFDPAGVPPEWAQTSLVRRAKTIPGLTVMVDRAGTIAAKLGVKTSGQTVLFDRNGRQIFSGGITGTRGHAGENRGRNLVLALAKGEICESPITPVFGCALQEKIDLPEEKP